MRYLLLLVALSGCAYLPPNDKPFCYPRLKAAVHHHPHEYFAGVRCGW